MLSEKVLFAINDIADDKIEAVAEIVGEYAPAEESRRKHTSVRRMLILAAVIAAFAAVAAAAYALGLFSFTHRGKMEAEKYSLSWDNQNGEIVFDDFKYVFKFTGPEECKAVQFKEGWLPFAPNENVNDWAKDEEGWRTRLVSECAPGVDSTSTNYQPYRVELFYVPQFVDDGALILNYQTPEEIKEEQWGEHQVLKFHATWHQDAIDDDLLDFHIPARDFYYYFVILFQPEQGYIAVVSGTSDMETIEHVARELQFRQTEDLIRKEDFANNCTFIDVGQG